MNKNICLNEISKCKNLEQTFQVLNDKEFELVGKSQLSKNMVVYNFKDTEGNQIELLSTKQHSKDFVSNAYDVTYSECMLDNGIVHKSLGVFRN